MAIQLIQTSNFFNQLQGKFGIVFAVYKMAEKRFQYYGCHSAKRAVDAIIDVKWGVPEDPSISRIAYMITSGYYHMIVTSG